MGRHRRVIMNYRQAIALRDELLAEKQHTEVYVDRVDKHDKSFGFKTIALKCEPKHDAKAGREVQKIVDEVHHLNYDRTGAIVI
jgi:hypothetical protein